jgi:hypothetical protein
MMLYRALLVLLVTLSGAVASEISLRGGEEDSSEVTSTNNRDLKVKPDRVQGCKESSWGYELTTLPPSYRVPGDLLPSYSGHTLNVMCQIVPVSCPCFTAERFRAVVNTAGSAPKTCIKEAPDFVLISTAHGEGGCSGYNDPTGSGYNCGNPGAGVPGVPDKFSCHLQTDAGPVHVDRINAAENNVCQAIIIKEMFDCV